MYLTSDNAKHLKGKCRNVITWDIADLNINKSESSILFRSAKLLDKYCSFEDKCIGNNLE